MNNLIKQIIESKFNFNIDIEDIEKQNSLSISKYNSISLKQLYLNLYIVDLGLPSKTIWCRYNLGVNINLLNTNKDWFGNYYAYGETETKNEYTWENYKFGKISYIEKYNKKDKLNLLLLEDDAAYLNMHIENYKFHIPNRELFEELLEYTNNEWIKNYNDINGLNGRIFKSKINGNEMFIPEAGYCYDSELYDTGAYLLSSSLNTNSSISYAWYLFVDFGLTGMYYINRCFGLSIRPVLYIN